jgi:hypothetical protein
MLLTWIPIWEIRLSKQYLSSVIFCTQYLTKCQIYFRQVCERILIDHIHQRKPERRKRRKGIKKEGKQVNQEKNE